MAAVEPFRAARYAADAGPLGDLVAPPYDVVSAQEHARLAAKHPHNVVHVTLDTSERDAGSLFAEWGERGVVVRDAEPAVWTLEQVSTGPDGVARRLQGLVATVGLEPFERRVVLPHERTHAAPRESRLRLLRAARAQLEPVLLLYEGDPPISSPATPPDLDSGEARLWRHADAGEAVSAFFAERDLLIADGHHRYEVALAYHGEDGTPASGWIMAVLVSATAHGIDALPTHRVFSGRPELREAEGVLDSDPERLLTELAALPADRAAAVAWRPGGGELVQGVDGLLDVELIEELGHEGLSYTVDWREAVRRVDEGSADAAFLLREPPVERVMARARQGERMPPKSTYFLPKPLSGLLFQPL